MLCRSSNQRHRVYKTVGLTITPWIHLDNCSKQSYIPSAKNPITVNTGIYADVDGN